MLEMHLTCLSSAGMQPLPAFLLPILTHLCSFLDAVPTAELEPITETYVQADEVCAYDLEITARSPSLLLVL